MIRILIADDHVIVRAGLREFIADQPDMEVAAEASTGAEAIAAARAQDFDVVLLDIMMPDKNGELWTGGMSTDRVVRFDPKTGQSTEYLLPRTTNIRRVFVDNSTNPVTFWTGSNHGAAIVKLEPLD